MRTRAIGLPLVIVIAAMLSNVGWADARDVKEFVSKIYIEGIPYEEAAQFDASAVPTLLEMLQNPDEKRYWSNVVVTLGAIGDERAVEPLIKFLEEGDGEAVSRPEYLAKKSVLPALGYLVNKNPNPTALAYLKSSADPAAWSQRNLKWRPPDSQDENERNLSLTKRAIVGLGLSGNPEARETLERIQQGPPEGAMRPKLQAITEEAKKYNEMISREGLTEYYKKQRSLADQR